MLLLFFMVNAYCEHWGRQVVINASRVASAHPSVSRSAIVCLLAAAQVALPLTVLLTVLWVVWNKDCGSWPGRSCLCSFTRRPHCRVFTGWTPHHLGYCVYPHVGETACVCSSPLPACLSLLLRPHQLVPSTGLGPTLWQSAPRTVSVWSVQCGSRQHHVRYV